MLKIKFMNVIKAIYLHRKLRIEEEILKISRIDYVRYGNLYESFPLSNTLSAIEKVIEKIENKYKFLSRPSIMKIHKILEESKNYYYSNKSKDLPYKWNINVKINLLHFLKSCD